MNIYVGNLPYSITEDELRELFAAYGEVTTVTLITDRLTGQSKGFGFIEMPVRAEAEAAIRALAGSSVKGRNLKVNKARARPARGPRAPHA